jgi:hypothetical protein
VSGSFAIIGIARGIESRVQGKRAERKRDEMEATGVIGRALQLFSHLETGTARVLDEQRGVWVGYLNQNGKRQLVMGWKGLTFPLTGEIVERLGEWHQEQKGRG